MNDDQSSGSQVADRWSCVRQTWLILRRPCQQRSLANPQNKQSSAGRDPGPAALQAEETKRFSGALRQTNALIGASAIRKRAATLRIDDMGW